MSIVFDGANDSIVVSPGFATGLNIPTTGITLVSLHKKNLDNQWQAAGPCFRTNSSTTRYGWEYNLSGPTFNPINVGDDVTSIGTTGVGSMIADGWCLGASAHTNAAIPLLAAGVGIGGAVTWRSGNAPGTLSITAGTVQDIIFGEWGGNVDDFNGSLAVAAWWNSTLTLAQIQECVANLRTSDFWNNSAGRPKGLWEFNSAGSIVDLTGNGANEVSRGGAPTFSATDPAGWTYDGTAPRTDNFNRANQNPLTAPWTNTGPVSFVLTSNAVTSNSLGSDSSAVRSSTPWGNDQYSKAKLTVTGTAGGGTGPGLFVRGASAAVTGYRLATDHAATNNFELGRFIAGAFTSLAVFTRAWTDGDTFELRVTGPATAARLEVFHNGTSVQVFTDNSSIASGSPGIAYSSISGAFTIDDWEGNDVLAIAALAGPAPTWSAVPPMRGARGPRRLVEVRYVEDLSVGSTPFSDTETFTLGESVQIDVAMLLNDTLTLSDVYQLSALLSASDAFSMVDSSNLVQQLLLFVTDGLSFADAWSLTAQMAGVDALTLSEAVSIAATLSAVDSATLSDSSALSQLLTVTDSAAFADSALAASVFNVSDVFSMADAYQLTAQLARTDNMTLAEAVSIAAALAGTDALSLSEQVALSQLLTATDAFSMADAGVVSALALFSVSDAFSAADSYQLTAQLARTDAAGLTEAALIAAALVATDAFTESEAAALAAALTASDSGALSESSSVATVNLLTGTDTFTQTTSAAVDAALSASDSFAQSAIQAATVALQVTDVATLSEAASVAAALGITDALVLTESGLLTQTQFKVATDAFTLADASSLSTAAPPPDFDLPTTASVAIWAASAVLASNLTSVTLTPNDSSAAVASSPMTAAVAGVDYRAVVVPFETTVELD